MKKNKGTSKKIAFIAMLLLMGNFLILGGSSADQGDERGRAGEITISDLIVGDPFMEARNINGVYGNEIQRIFIDFDINVNDVVNVWANITINNAAAGYSDHNNTSLGNPPSGQNGWMADLNFQEPGIYTITGTVEGYHVNSSSLVSDTRVESHNFTSILYVDINHNIMDNKAYNGYYAKDRTTLECWFNNSGNAGGHVNITFDIVDSMGTPEELAVSEYEIWDFRPEENAQPTIIPWWPSHEDTFTVTVTVTTDPDTLPNASTNVSIFDIIIQNITDIELNLTDISGDGVYQGEEFTMVSLLSNQGNAIFKSWMLFKYYPIGQPQDAVTMGNMTLSIDPQVNEDDHPFEAFFLAMIEEPGNYTLMAEIPTLGVSDTTTIEVFAIPNGPPLLINMSYSPDENIGTGDDVTFSIVYVDIHGDPGDVIIFIDETPYYMSPQDTTWKDGVEFTYTWEATWEREHDLEGDGHTHEFYFFTEDVRGHNAIFDYGGINYTLEVLPPTIGKLSGKVTDQLGESIPNAAVVIYNGEEYFNITSDTEGNYSMILPLDEYFVYLNEIWAENNGFKDTFPQSQPTQSKAKIVLDLDTIPMVLNFIAARDIILGGTSLEGRINNTLGESLEDVEIKIVIFYDVMDVLIEETVVEGVVMDISVNVTYRTWYNLSYLSDENGEYYFPTIPLDMHEIKTLPVSGMKLYREDRETLPSSPSLNYWPIEANKANYEFETAILTKRGLENTMLNKTIKDGAALQIYFKRGMTSGGYITLDKMDNLIEDNNVTFRGNIWPSNADMVVDGEPVTTIGGNFAMILLKGIHTITASAAGYETYEATINLTSNVYGYLIDLVNSTLVVEFGPFVDNEGDNIAGVTVSFSLEDGIEYCQATDDTGKVSFELLAGWTIPDDADIKLKYNGGEATKPYSWFGENDNVDVSTIFDGGDGNLETSSEEAGALYMIPLAVILGFVIIFAVITALVIGAKRKRAMKGTMEAGAEIMKLKCPTCGEMGGADDVECAFCGAYLEKGVCSDCGSAVDEDMEKCPACLQNEVEEFECPGCGIWVMENFAECPNCGHLMEEQNEEMDDFQQLPISSNMSNEENDPQLQLPMAGETETEELADEDNTDNDGEDWF